MNHKHAFLAAIFGVLLPLMSAFGAVRPPNIVLILGEAQGWASMSVPLDDRDPVGSRSDYILTPHLDAIAMAGTRFSDFYAASPRCTPTRAALMTGHSPAALHMTFVHEGRKDARAKPGDKVIAPTSNTELPTKLPTIASLLKDAGYATAHFGKWHVGRTNPREYGFDENDGANNNGGPDEVESPNPVQCHAIARLGMDFMERQVKAGKPFFLQLSEYPGRGPEMASPEVTESVRQRLGTRMDFNRIGIAAGNEEVDKTIGRVLTRLKELGVTGHTYIIYTADHGAQGRNINGSLSLGKGTVWEGGLRVPLLVAGPGVKAGAFAHTRASTVDLLPTIADLAGLDPHKLPPAVEGGSLAGILKGGGQSAVKRAREDFVVHFPHYDNDELGPASAIFQGKHKLIRFYESGQDLLFDLSTDAREQHDLAATKPDVLKDLGRMLDEHLASVQAALPTPNPDFDPQGERSGNRRQGEKRPGKRER